MNLIERGAEAEIYLEDDEIIKKRTRKRYRHPEVDRYIREKRTKKEAQITSEVRKVGVPTPIILDIKDFIIKFEYISGNKLKNVFHKLKEEDFKNIGKNIGKIHTKEVVHGDLTTSNILISDKEIYFIDFGLSAHEVHVESRGIDLHVLFQTIRSSHPSYENRIKDIVSGYQEEFKDSEKVLNRVKEIERRGRYVD
ncbi:MAG: tRNA A-37 threonylcarbamoyl transferase component Bud32 [Candidatus Methanohalarchaeum thermophilum]|uniref:non-specific serine/threonine protein kinase n=1 Tax=Methanohalarchaeum thermophilum TaxID=1903181 RepID=A0A1Q6DV30_METT1|nr:MAG: tRNA A-37 threonylcarbamoyl transferase component Bud32 [Candidatus Methanohalarchaeum thermophilum]